MFNFNIELKYNLLHLRWISSCMTVMQTTIGLWPNHHMRSVPKLINLFLNLKSSGDRDWVGWVWDPDQDLPGRSCGETRHHLPCAQAFPGIKEHPVTQFRFVIKTRKLFLFLQTGTGPSTDPSALKGGKSVVSEFYDEIIFQDPTQYIQVGRPLAKSLYDKFILVDAASPDYHQTAHYGGS